MGNKIVIIGAGPAGLTAAYELIRHGYQPLVLEQSDSLGGISRTEVYKGYHFDIGGHRFYTKVEEVKMLWEEMLGEDFQRRPRLSRIYYGGKFYKYPLDFVDALSNLGLVESFRILLSYLNARLLPYRQEDTFEEWVSNRFGRRLYHMFFRTYTEKVWGIPTNKIQADWAAQRIQNLSLRTAVIGAIFGTRNTKIKTLINEFDYPLRGPGMMWDRFGEVIEQRGGEVRLNSTVERVHIEHGRVSHLTILNNGEAQDIRADHVISSMPLRQLIHSLNPTAPHEVGEAASDLHYRDFIQVGLIVNRKDVFPDNWIYVHSPEVKVGRIQNFKNWSPDMVPDLEKTSLGMEYFCNQGDDLWMMPDEAFIQLASEEIARLGLAATEEIEDGVVIRQLKAYPVYDPTYRHNLTIIQQYLDTIPTLQTIGRNGLHRYNNQDHSMLTGLLAARNILGERHDLWSVNTERSYYETFITADPDTSGNGTVAVATG